MITSDYNRYSNIKTALFWKDLMIEATDSNFPIMTPKGRSQLLSLKPEDVPSFEFRLASGTTLQIIHALYYSSHYDKR